MKERIYEIPVNDAFRAAAAAKACPVCVMRRELEQSSLEYALGPSYMEDDARALTDASGFCPKHWEKLYAMQNRLGLSLIMLTHVQHIIRSLEQLGGQPAKRAGIFSKPAGPGASSKALFAAADNCCVCERVSLTLERYIGTMFLIWQETPGLRECVEAGGGFCLPHFAGLLRTGPPKPGGRAWEAFLADVLPIQREALKTLEGDLGWFVKKFDYRYADEPWGGSKDALPRAIRSVGGVNADMSI